MQRADHSVDIGGGSVSNATKDCLADIPLRWMVRQVEEAQCGIVFDSDALAAQNIPEYMFAAAPDAPAAAHRSPPAMRTHRSAATHSHPPCPLEPGAAPCDLTVSSVLLTGIMSHACAGSSSSSHVAGPSNAIDSMRRRTCA